MTNQVQTTTTRYYSTSFEIFTIVNIKCKNDLLRTYNQQTKYKRRQPAIIRTGFTIITIDYESNLLRTYNQLIKHITAHGVLLLYAQILPLSATSAKAIY